MNNRRLKKHIEANSFGYPEPMQKKALIVLEEKIKDDLIRDWAVNNKEDIVKYLNFIKEFGSVNKFKTELDILKKHVKTYQYKNKKGFNTDDVIRKILIKIDLL